MKFFDIITNENGLDFPFYNGKPKLSKFDWFVFSLAPILTISVILGWVFYIPGAKFLINDDTAPIILCLICLIPAAYVCKGKLSIFFKMPKRSDLIIIILCWIFHFLFTAAIVITMYYLGLTPQTNSTPIANSMSVVSTILLLIQLIGEELFKVSLLICVMAIIFHFSSNRKISVILSIIINLIVFGLIHLGAYNGNYIQCLLVIGLGSIFVLYPYLKTKNVVNSYFVHLLIDLFPVVLFSLKGLLGM